MTTSQPSLLPALVLSALLPLALLSAGCPSDNPCDASNCLGCCQDDGTCAPGTQTTACGTGGAACGSCADGQQCNSTGVCAAPCSDVCQEGEGRCEQGMRAACVRGANGCLAFAEAQECPGAQVCSGGACVDHCTDQCTEGQGRCAGSRVQTCERQITGCTEWGSLTTCSTGICRGGMCSATDTCTDACTAGARRCASSQRQETCQTGSSGCLEWVGQACGAEQTCTGTRCESVYPCSPPCPDGFTCSSALVCEGGPVTSIVLNTDLVTVSGRLTVNGAVPTYDASYCTRYPSGTLAHIIFRHQATAAEFTAYAKCGQSDVTFTTRLSPGTYDVFARPDYGNSANLRMAPARIKVASNVTIDSDVTDLKVNAVLHAVSGRLTVNGTTPTLANAAYCTSNPQTAVVDLSLTRLSPATGEDSYITVPIDCAHSSQFTFDSLLPPGEYKVAIAPSVSGRSAGPRVLAGSQALATNLVVSGPVTNLVYNQVAHAVSGRITVNGATPTLKSGTCTSSRTVAQIYASTTGFSGFTDVPCSTDFSFSLLVPPGSVTLSFRDGASSLEPAVTNLSPISVSKVLSVTGPLANVVLNQDVYPVSGKLTVNGAAPVLKTACPVTGRLASMSLQNASGGYGSMAITCSDNFQFATALPAGTYEVTARAWDGASNLAEGSYQFPPFTISGATANLVLDEVLFNVLGKLTVNGVTPTGHEVYCGQSSNKGSVLAQVAFDNTALRGADGLASVTCMEPDFTFSGMIPAGTYLVETKWGSSLVSSSINFVPGKYPSLTVSAPVTNLVLNREVRTVSGRLLVNGLPPTVDASYCANPSNQASAVANISFKDEATGFSQSASVRCKDPNFSFTTLLPPGTYDVRVINANSIWNPAGANFSDGPARAVAKLRIP